MIPCEVPTCGLSARRRVRMTVNLITGLELRVPETRDLCEPHARALEEAMRRQSEAIKTWLSEAEVDDRGGEVCRIRGCHGKPVKRGLCSICYDRISRAGRLDEFGLPRESPFFVPPSHPLDPVKVGDTERRGVNLAQLARLRQRGWGPSRISQETGCAKSTIYRVIKEIEEAGISLDAFLSAPPAAPATTACTPTEEAPLPVAVHMSPIKKKSPRKAPAPPELEPPCICVEATPAAPEALDSAPAAAPAASEETTPAPTHPDDCEGWEEAPESARVEAPPAWPLERAGLRNEILNLRVEVARLNAERKGLGEFAETMRDQANVARVGAKRAEEALADARARVASLEEHLRAAREQSRHEKAPPPAAALLAFLLHAGPVLDLLKGWTALGSCGLSAAALRAARSGIEREIRLAIGASEEEDLGIAMVAERLATGL